MWLIKRIYVVTWGEVAYRSITQWAISGLINQHAGEKAVRRVAQELFGAG
jgi:hypothetical protein